MAEATPPVADGVAMEFAPAKINLALHVVGRRPDGYHDLESLVVFAEGVGDTVAATDAPAPGLVVEGPLAAGLDATAAASNLVTRAANMLMPRHPMRWTVTKRIPVAAGLGGGSADAAAAMRLLNRRRQPPLATIQLAESGRPLGADVPMCVVSRPLIARGVGEEIDTVGFPALPLVLVCPPMAVKTADVFRALAKADQAPLPPLPRLTDVEGVVEWLRGTRNDLADPAARVSPEAAMAATGLGGDPECLFARMTGSGPTAFGIFASRAAADRAAVRIGAKHRSWWVTSATTGAS